MPRCHLVGCGTRRDSMLLVWLLGFLSLDKDCRLHRLELAHPPPLEPLKRGSRVFLRHLGLEMHLELIMHGYSQGVPGALAGHFALIMFGTLPGVSSFASESREGVMQSSSGARPL